MKFSVLQENLKQGLTAVAHIAGKNSSLPILNNIKMEAINGNINLTSTNLEIGINSVVRGKVEQDGSFTVDAKIILDFINLLPNKKIDIELLDNKLIINCESFSTKINGLTSDEFPLIPTIADALKISVDVNELVGGLSQVIFAVAPQDGRVELSGVFCVVRDGLLTLVATDSYRLAEKTITISGEVTTEMSVIVPVRTMQEVVRIISNLKGVTNVDISITENQILFSTDSVEIVSRIIEGQYPDYKQIIPTTHKTKARVSVSEYVRSIKAASIFSKSGVNDVSLDLPADKNILMISATSGQVGESVSQIEAMVEGVDNGVVVNYRYLIDGLNSLKTEMVDLLVVDGNTPCVFKPVGVDNYQYIIMPIRQ